MATIVVLSGSPSATSRTAALTEHLAARLEERGHRTTLVRIRDLPARALIGADATQPEIAQVVHAIEEADGLLVASPIYKAAYTGCSSRCWICCRTWHSPARWCCRC
jgi:FMN reductase